MSYQQQLGWGHFKRTSVITALSLGIFSMSYLPAAWADLSLESTEATVVDASPDESIEASNQVTETLRLVLRISERRVYLYRGDRVLNSYPVAVGAADTPTPQGEFAVSQMVIEPVWQSPWTGEFHAPGANSALGLRWIGFSTSESGSFGFHGTPTLRSIGQAVSNGCVRMQNEDIVALFSRVSVGTPVVVVP